MSAATAYPLAWPVGWKRTGWADRTGGGFKVTLAKALDTLEFELDTLEFELEKLGCSDVILSTDIPRKLSGALLSVTSDPDDPGAAVYFNFKGKPMCLACDRYSHIAYNVRAISLTVEALRGIDRWGASGMLERAFVGFAALPPATDWRARLGFNGGPVTEVDVKREFNRLMMAAHPDKGGTASEVQLLTEARDANARIGGALTCQTSIAR